jgi:hypothetical protein
MCAHNVDAPERRTPMSAQQRATQAPTFKRLNINLPLAVYDELENLARVSSRTMTEIVRTALGLAKVAINEEVNGNKLAIVNSEGKLLKEIVLVR